MDRQIDEYIYEAVCQSCGKIIGFSAYDDTAVLCRECHDRLNKWRLVDTPPPLQ